ncbi:MAG: HEAT repeat domain-containing protein [Pirellulales bacterium]|nr:HEAT repeat domain-containing protein [Pirellulales bacterium]
MARRLIPRHAPWLCRAALILSACGLLIGLWWIARPELRWSLDRYATHLLERTESASVPDSEAIQAVRKLELLGNPGLKALAKAIRSPRLPVARAASEVLVHRIEGWQSELAAADDSIRQRTFREINLFAMELAQGVQGDAEYGPEALGIAARLAWKLLILAAKMPAVNQGDLIAHCESILEKTGIPHHHVSQDPRGASVVLQPDPLSRELAMSGKPDMDRLAPLSGGGLPLVERSIKVPRIEPPVPSEPSRLDGQVVDCPAIPSKQTGQNSDSFQGTWRPWNQAHAMAASNPGLPDPDHPSHTTAVDPAEISLDPLSLRDLMHRLHDPNATTALAAARELRIRGFSELELGLARKIASPDINLRRQLIEEIPHIPDIDGRRWLFWLAEDDHVDIRLAAMTLLATITDPATQRRLLELASQDQDPRVITLAERLATLNR